ncbi:aminotransferase class IV [Paenibacillus alkalitolerans]|uniref:aminotransferase class IV n=1 Tax=Paenibacillus alkalitolerans TaxID=2799335 RepID=UPI0018F6FD47|nr:aminotransferase class IV [Paenibacillus alkalitolerans]
MKLWLNGKIMNEEEAVIPVSDHGFLYGMGLFETFRTYGGEAFLLDRHLERLAEGCRALRIEYEPQEPEIRNAVSKLLASGGLSDAYVRLTVSAGPAPLGLPGAGGYSTPNVLMHIKELPRVPSDPELRAKVLIKLTLPRSSPEHAVRLKSFQFMNNVFGKWEVLSKAGTLDAEGLFLNGKGYVAEGVVSNVFFVRGSVLATPSLATGCLPGVTRSFVMELARGIGMSAEEGFYRWEQLLEADEVFITNSVQEIVPVSVLVDEDGKAVELSGGKPGKMTLRLIEQYHKKTKQGGDI